jgi:hypothetical protein
MGRGARREARTRYGEFVEEAARQGLEKTPWENLIDEVVLGSQRLLARLHRAGAVNLAIKRYERLVESNAQEAKRLKACPARLDQTAECLNAAFRLGRYDSARPNRPR